MPETPNMPPRGGAPPPGGLPGGPQGPTKRSPWRSLLPILLLIAAAFWIARLGGSSLGQGPTISYTDFRHALRHGDVVSVTIKGNKIRGLMHSGALAAIEKSEAASGTGAAQGTGRHPGTAAPASSTGKAVPAGGSAGGHASPPAGASASSPPAASQPADMPFVTYVPAFGDTQLLPLLEAQGVEVRAQPQSGTNWWLLLITILPIVFIGFLFLMLMGGMRGQQSGIFTMGKNRAHLYSRSEEQTFFRDVAGAEGAKAELREIIEYLKEPRRLRSLGGKPPRGVLLLGPPGTGKTLLARATAGEAGVPFFSITGSDFMEMFVGVGASRVRNLFLDARRAAPCIIFIDELDSVGRQRGAGIGGGHDEREQTLNQLLSEMDGFEPNSGVIVMAATNRPDILDSALLRPGRFDRSITVDMPGVEARRDILRIHARKKPLAPDVDLDAVARGTPGFSGAELENLLNEAALLAARKRKDSISTQDIDEARDKLMMGLEREGLALSKEDYRMLAYHEAGHAVVAAVLPNADPVHKVTIVPRGKAMGLTQQLPDREKYIYSREYMGDRLAVMMGGRAAEELIFGTATSGAESDLKQVVQLARKMVLDWGMGASLQDLALGGERRNIFLGEEITQRRPYSDETAREVDEEIRSIIDAAHARARQVLETHRDGLDRVADALCESEVLPGSRVLELLGPTAARKPA